MPFKKIPTKNLNFVQPGAYNKNSCNFSYCSIGLSSLFNDTHLAFKVVMIKN